MQTRLCVETNVQVLCWIRNAFDAEDEHIYGWRRKRLALKMNTPYSIDKHVENVRLLFLAFDRYCMLLYTAIYTQWCSLLD